MNKNIEVKEEYTKDRLNKWILKYGGYICAVGSWFCVLLLIGGIIKFIILDVDYIVDIKYTNGTTEMFVVEEYEQNPEYISFVLENQTTRIIKNDSFTKISIKEME